MMPVLGGHDRSAVEVFCYSVSRRPDAMAAALEAKAEHWRAVAALSAEELAGRIYADEIDVLVDLSMHTIDNALLTFARKPAPVQITYLAYCAGTGLRAIDWRLTDGVIDPPSAEGGRQTFERPLRLETYWCYTPSTMAGEVTELPALRTREVAAGAGEERGITLGSFNFYSKVNEEVLGAWAELLNEMPGARLMLHVPAGSVQAKVRRFFGERGVAAERVVLVGRVAEVAYFAQYGEVDIGLDTYPFAGGTTTCDALWMGVPVVTRTGSRTTARGGASILTAVGLPELIAADWASYRRIVKELAADRERLAGLRRTMRERMRASVLMDAPRFVRRLEGAYREAWEAFQERGSG
jgi:predicted O-linked N-acetylglucosamine transferase (SPINDLY family)